MQRHPAPEAPADIPPFAGSAGVLPAWAPLAVATAALIVIVGSPVFGWFPVVRLSAVALPMLAVLVLTAAPWRWSDADWARAAGWLPPARTAWIGVAAGSLLLAWIVFSRFWSGGINAVDFTIYFDRPLYQTSLGHWYLVESTDDARFDYLTHLAVHAYWILLPLAALYWIHATPYWLLALSVVAVVAGSVHIYRAARHLGCGGLLASAAAVAFLINDNTARTLNYGFHAEVLYAWFIPWAIDAGLRGARGSFLVAVLASVLVKEDAVFPLFALSAALALLRGGGMGPVDRLLFLVLPVTLALANLAAYYAFIVPRLSPSGDVMYSYFWSSHGPTPWASAKAMLRAPGTLIWGALTSGFFAVVLARHLFLPLLGWRWIVGLMPLVVVYGASDNDQVRAFGIYYAVPLVPFLILASTQGARLLSGRLWGPDRAELAAALMVVVSVLAVGLGYSLRPWKAELRQVRTAIDRLPPRDVVLVQSGLYPHAGYEARVKLLAPHSLDDPRHRGAIVLLGERASAYPFAAAELECLAALPPVEGMPPGLRAVRLQRTPPKCGPATPKPHPRRRSILSIPNP